MDTTHNQYSRIQFFVPNGINNHIVLGVQATVNGSPTGYFVILGYDGRLCGNPGGICSQPYLGIEKAVSYGNWLSDGVPVGSVNGYIHKLYIQTMRYADRMVITVGLLRYYPFYGWSNVGQVTKSDYNNTCDYWGSQQETYCNYLTGNRSFFADVFASPSLPILWDKYYVEWN